MHRQMMPKLCIWTNDFSAAVVLTVSIYSFDDKSFQ